MDISHGGSLGQSMHWFPFNGLALMMGVVQMF